MPKEKGNIAPKSALTMSNAKLKSGIKTVNQQIVDELTRAFGDEVRFHIKESGPTWVNSPRPPRPPRPRQAIKQSVQIVVHNEKK